MPSGDPKKDMGIVDAHVEWGNYTSHTAEGDGFSGSYESLYKNP